VRARFLARRPLVVGRVQGALGVGPSPLRSSHSPGPRCRGRLPAETFELADFASAFTAARSYRTSSSLRLRRHFLDGIPPPPLQIASRSNRRPAGLAPAGRPSVSMTGPRRRLQAAMPFQRKRRPPPNPTAPRPVRLPGTRTGGRGHPFRALAGQCSDRTGGRQAIHLPGDGTPNHCEIHDANSARLSRLLAAPWALDAGPG